MAEQSLFGTTPEELMASRDAALRQQAAQYAQLDPFQQATMGIYQGASKLGGAIGGMLGGQDPEMMRIKQRQQLLQGVNPEDADALIRAAQQASQMGDYGAAQELSTKARAMQLQKAQIGKTQAEQRKLDLAAQQETIFREELVKLGPNATQEAVLSAAIKAGSPDKILTVIQGSLDKEAARTQALDLAKTQGDSKVEAARIAGEARIDAAREAGANRLQIAQLQEANRLAIANMQADTKLLIANMTNAFKQSLAANKPLPPSLQKEEGTDLAAIDTYEAQQRALAPAIANLTPNAQGVSKLELGPVKNAFYMAQNAAGNSTPESRAYEGLKSAVDTAVNLQVSAEKGVQTDKDVLRFAQALIGAYGRNDTKATLEALTRYEQSLAKAAEKTMNRLESRRKSQNIEPYKPALGTPSNPIKLD